MSQVVNVAPSVPQIKNGIARRLADAPKVLVKRDILVGKTEDVPNPAIEAPTLKTNMSLAKSKIPEPVAAMLKFIKSI